MFSVTAYTCVTGGFDKLDVITAGKPKNREDTSFVIYTDAVQKPEERGFWEVRPVEWKHPSNPRRTARWHKTNSHLLIDSKFSLWFDGALQFKNGTDIVQMLHDGLAVEKGTAKYALASFKHPQRVCVYQENTACARMGKDDPQVMQEQVDRYRHEGYPPYNGMVETSCVIRYQNLDVTKFNEHWWREIEHGSLRDQLSFNYCCWRLGLEYGHLPGRRDVSPYFTFHPHKRK